MKSYFRRLAEGYEDGAASVVLRPFLEAAQHVYGATVGTVRSLYEHRLLPRKRLPYPVVSVGNLTWGGTGKTPFVEYLARKVGERRRTTLILTRGYSHDEVNQLRHHVPKAVIGVGKNRFRVAGEMGRKHRIDLVVLDDGMQHWPIERDIEIIVVNALNPFGNEKLIPKGILREPVAMLKRAAIIVLSHVNLVSRKKLEKLKSRIRDITPDAFIVESYLEPLFFYRARKRSRVSLDRLAHKRVTTFSGVGFPKSFRMLLSERGIKPVRNFEFTDHYVFSEADLQEIKEVSDAADAEEIITTEKDFYRAPELITRKLNPLILATRLRIAAGEEILTNRLFRLLGIIR